VELQVILETPAQVVQEDMEVIMEIHSLELLLLLGSRVTHLSRAVEAGQVAAALLHQALFACLFQEAAIHKHP